MEVRKIAGLIVALWLMSAGAAYAITWELSGKLGAYHSPETPQALVELTDTPFTAYLTYDENASPTSIWSEGFANYANQGSFVLSTALGTASGNFDNLQTFIFNGVPGEGSNFTGGSFNVALAGPISSLSLVPVSFDFSFHESPWGEGVGLSSFALPTDLSLDHFDDSFIRLEFLSSAGLPYPDTSLLGVINNISPVPEPHVYAMMLAGLGLLGFRCISKAEPHALV